VMRCAHAVALFATTLVRGAVAQGPTNHLPNHGWQYHTACVPPNIAPAEVFDCMAKLSLVQWNCNATEGPGNTVNQSSKLAGPAVANPSVCCECGGAACR
jgi:hypothetical protein